MMTSTDVRRFVDHALGLGNSGDLDGLAGLFDPNVVMVGPDGTVKGSEAVRAAFDVLYTAFPGLQVEINNVAGEGKVHGNVSTTLRRGQASSSSCSVSLRCRR